MTTRQVTATSWVMIGLSILLRGVIIASGGFYWDDFILQGRAARLPLNLEFLSYSHDGHLMPAAMAVSWLTERAAPLEFWLPAMEMLIGQALLAISGWWLLRRVFTARPGTLVPLAYFCFTGLTLPGNSWWAAALNAIPLQLAMVVATAGLFGYLRGVQRWRSAVLVVGSVGVALAFFEKSVVLLPWLMLAAWIFAPDARPWPFLRDQWRRVRWLWLALLAVVGTYAWWFTSNQTRELSNPGVSEIALTLRQAVIEAIAPTLLGGPGGWMPVGYGMSAAAAPTWFTALSVMVLIAMIVVASATSARAIRAWVAAGLYVIGITVLFALGRTGLDGTPLLMTAMRYTADATLPLTLAIGFTFLPLAGEQPGPRVLAVRHWLTPRRWLLWPVAGALALLTLFATTATFTGYWANWVSSPAKPWLANARTSMAADATGTIIRQDVPEYILFGLANPYHRTDWLLAPLPQRPTFADFTDNPRFINFDGTMVPGMINGVASPPGPEGSCGYLLTGDGLHTIALTADVFEWEHRVELDYLASAETTALVALGTGSPTTVDMPAGLGRMVVLVEGGGTAVTISGLTPGVTVCVSRVAVGQWLSVSAAPAG